MTRPIAFTYQAWPARIVFGVGAVNRVGAASPSPAVTHPRPADEPAIRALLAAAYHGRRPAVH